MKILGYDYTVSYLPRVKEGGADASGCCTVTRQTILVDRDQVRQCMESTVLHEIIEALNKHLSLGLEHPIMERLEAGLYTVFRDSGVDMSFLLKDLENYTGGENIT